MRKKILGLLFEHIKNLSTTGRFYSERKVELAEGILPIYKTAVETGIQMIVREVSGSPTLDLDGDSSFMEFMASKKVRAGKLIETLSRKIAQEVVEGTQSGETIEQIGDRLRGVFNLLKSRRSVLASMEVRGAVNFGRWLALERIEMGSRQWISSKDSKGCHQDMNGKVVESGQPWVLSSGDVLRYPGDWKTPGRNVVDCSCVEGAVLR